METPEAADLVVSDSFNWNQRFDLQSHRYDTLFTIFKIVFNQSSLVSVVSLKPPKASAIRGCCCCCDFWICLFNYARACMMLAYTFTLPFIYFHTFARASFKLCWSFNYTRHRGRRHQNRASWRSRLSCVVLIHPPPQYNSSQPTSNVESVRCCVSSRERASEEAVKRES